MKKKFLLVLVLLCAVLLLSACGEKKEAAPLAASTGKVPTVINAAEYTLYQNIFFNNYASQYDGKSVSKRGIFTTIQDEYFGATRYYVWGYLDNTLCCDWQWEMQVDDPSVLPANGSLVDVSGTFVSDAGALDGYWISGAQVTTLTTYTGAKADVDMTTMSDTLERVQILNYQAYPEQFEGKSVFAFGRISDMTNVEDPYYGSSSWTTAFSTSETVPAIGTNVVLRGTLNNGVISEAKIENTDT